jgi:hypothetical protein
VAAASPANRGDFQLAVEPFFDDQIALRGLQPGRHRVHETGEQPQLVRCRRRNPRRQIAGCQAQHTMPERIERSQREAHQQPHRGDRQQRCDRPHPEQLCLSFTESAFDAGTAGMCHQRTDRFADMADRQLDDDRIVLEPRLVGRDSGERDTRSERRAHELSIHLQEITMTLHLALGVEHCQVDEARNLGQGLDDERAQLEPGS